jgi:hypothetical protein
MKHDYHIGNRRPTKDLLPVLIYGDGVRSGRKRVWRETMPFRELAGYMTLNALNNFPTLI